jgi:hypothetical protein
MKIHITNIIIISPKINILFIIIFWFDSYEFHDYLNVYFEIRKGNRKKKKKKKT